MELIEKRILDYIDFMREEHRATLDQLTKEGKTYRSRSVARERGYLNALVDIADAIERLIKRTDISKQMGLNGYNAVLKKYNWANEEKKLFQLFCDIG